MRAAEKDNQKRQYDQAIEDLRAALAEREGGDPDIRQELATGGAHLDVAEVLGELVEALTSDASTKSAASTLTSVGRITQAPCSKCGKSNSDAVDAASSRICAFSSSDEAQAGPRRLQARGPSSARVLTCTCAYC